MPGKVFVFVFLFFFFLLGGRRKFRRADKFLSWAEIARVRVCARAR